MTSSRQLFLSILGPVRVPTFTTASTELDETWDSAVEKFPAFAVALRTRATECNWAATAPQGILIFNVPNTANLPSPAIYCSTTTPSLQLALRPPVLDALIPVPSRVLELCTNA